MTGGFTMGKQSVWKSYDQKELKEVNAVCERYKTCLDAGKTERECVKLGKKMADTCKIVKTDSTII